MVNIFDTRRHFPATEALREMERGEMPRQNLRRRVTPSNPSKISSEERLFDMTELIGVTDPLEDVSAFPRIEWAIDDEPPIHHVASLQVLPPTDNDDPMQLSQHSHSSHSSPTLGKRSRRSYQSRLVRSKSLKSSLCYLAEQSVSCRRRHVFIAKEGSWGQFVCHSDEEHDSLRTGAHHSSKTDQMDLFSSSFIIFCPNEQSGPE